NTSSCHVTCDVVQGQFIVDKSQCSVELTHRQLRQNLRASNFDCESASECAEQPGSKWFAGPIPRGVFPGCLRLQSDCTSSESRHIGHVDFDRPVDPARCRFTHRKTPANTRSCNLRLDIIKCP